MEIIEIEPETLNIDNFQIPEFKINESTIENEIEDIISKKPSSNFGGGIELLMNGKTINEKKTSSSIDIEDITTLENELNDLTENNSSRHFDDKLKLNTNTNNTNSNSNSNTNSNSNKKEINYGQPTGTTKKSIFGGLFGDSKNNGANIKPVTKNDENDPINLGKSTANMNENKTWDGFGKFNNVPINLDKAQEKPELTKEEELKEKFKYLRKLEDLEKKGVSLSKRYNMDSNLNEMIGEYETIIAEKEKSNAIKFQGKMLMACITGLEFLNNKFDPFDICSKIENDRTE